MAVGSTGRTAECARNADCRIELRRGNSNLRTQRQRGEFGYTECAGHFRDFPLWGEYPKWIIRVGLTFGPPTSGLPPETDIVTANNGSRAQGFGSSFDVVDGSLH
jgi:hypothetical protein